ncbi:MAG: hypothetical protein VYE18_08980 [Pseudomonadota bacterium]|nr:hypothetical protein [Pseudomonadota bacterium]
MVLLTAPLDDHAGAEPVEDVARRFDGHNFEAPFLLAAAPLGPGLLALLRNSLTPRPIRQSIALWHYLRHGGVFTDWWGGADQYLPLLAERFHPDIIWASFGNTDCWNIARSLSATAGCPWAADIKDFWSTFIASPLRRHLAGRYRDAATFTALSSTHAADAAPWFGSAVETIYSGIDSGWLGREPCNSTAPSFSLTGTVGGGTQLEELKLAVKSWLETLPTADAGKLEFVYSGNDTALVNEVFSEIRSLCRVTVNGYVSLEMLRDIQTSSFANLYIKSDRTFHHKIFELLTAGRPAICYPEEGAEAKSLAAEIGATLHSAGNGKAVAAALGESLKRYPGISVDREAATTFTWDSQAEKLEALLLKTIRGESV